MRFSEEGEKECVCVCVCARACVVCVGNREKGDDYEVIIYNLQTASNSRQKILKFYLILKL